MTPSRNLHRIVAYILAASIVCPRADALISFDDGHDHVFFTGNVGFAWDSNVFANADAKSDSSITSSILAEYARRAGWIGVNGSLELDAARYNNLTRENFDNPKLTAEFMKETGRTTGSLTLSAARESRADAAVNLRTTTWNYATGLNFRYPIVGIYTLSGDLGYALTRYSGGVYPELATYSANINLIRILSDERDLMLGYRFRHQKTSVDTAFDDHAFTVGLSGKLIRGLNGSLSAGYQVRVPRRYFVESGAEPRFSSWTASGAATYAFNKRCNLTGSLAKDFSTTATDISVDSTTASLDVHYAFTSRWTASGSVSGGDSKFLGDAGRAVISLGPPLVLGRSRHDDYASVSASVNYSMNEHFKMSLGYIWFKNWSTIPIAVFTRSVYNLNLSSRW